MNANVVAETPVPQPGSTPTETAAATLLYAKNAKVAIASFTQVSDVILVALVSRILESMTGNPAYPLPFPKLDEVSAVRDIYVTAVNAYAIGKESIDARKRARAAMVQTLRDLALYVQHTCRGDRATLLTSGFPAQKTRRPPVGQLPAPVNVRLRHGPVSGQILALCKAQRQGRSYQWRYASAAAPTVWIVPAAVTSSRFTLENLVPGTVYTVQVSVLGASGPSDWSDAVSLMAM